ncbi:hypothetical protein J6I39_09935 [bacterium]|nr:hypothetical protein [bacterium]
MKVSLNLNQAENKNNINFTGYKWVKDEHGFKNFETSYVFDENRQDCYLEVFTLGNDEFNNYFINSAAKARNGGYRIKMNPGANRINLTKTFGIMPNQPFAYHYVVKNHNGGDEIIEIDAGDSIEEYGKAYNVVTPNGSQMSKGGSMKLVNIDSQNVGVVYDEHGKWAINEELKNRGMNAIKTLTNVYGGTAAGLEKDIEEGKFDSYTRIISLPVFTRENFTAHKYWIENIFQPCNDLMNINNYTSLQKKMFAHNLNFVSDGAFVNEGLMGTHFTNLLRWGENSPYFKWFRASNLKDSPLSLGVFPKRTENVSWKLVNSPKIYKQTSSGKVEEHTNKKYNPNEPTYIQFFDKRFVNDNEINNPQFLIKSYSKLNTKDGYDIHTHDDSVFPYFFEVNPQTVKENVIRFNQHNSYLAKDEKLKFDGYEAARIMSKNENFVVDGKFESGFETWDANPDIAKLNFVLSNNDLKTLKNMPNKEALAEESKIRQANCQVQDYTIEGGKYWTQKTDDILRLYIAQALDKVDAQNPSSEYLKITNKSDNKIFPEALKAQIFENEVENVLEGYYNFSRKLSDEDKKGQILEQLMNMPLETIEFGTNLVGVLGSPLISKRAISEEQVGVPRYELFKQGNPHLQEEYAKTYNEMDNIYQNEMSEFTTKVLDKVNEQLSQDNKLFDGDEVTEFGQYVLPIVVPQIAKFSIIKAFAPNLKAEFDKNNGEISYDYKALLNTHLQSLHLPKAGSPEDEAMLVLEKMKNGIKEISNKDEEFITKSVLTELKNTNVNSFKLADLIIDKTQAGLDWRIDATKDIADIDALRTHKQPFEDIWNDVNNFWEKFAKGIYSQNPNSYIVAEITDEDNLHMSAFGEKSPTYPNKKDILPKFFRNTGITANAQYSKFFYNIVKLYSRSFEDAKTLNSDENTFDLANQFKTSLMAQDNSLLKAFSLPAISYAYTFIGNHDKPRALHCAALDMDMFYSDLTFLEDKKHRMDAYRLIKDKSLDHVTDEEVMHFNFDNISPKAVAMGMTLRKGFMDVLNEYKKEMSSEEFDNNFKAISKAVADLSSGKFGNIRFDGDSFGVKPIDFNIKKVVEQAKNQYNFRFSNPEHEKNFENDTFEKIMVPAMSKVLAMMQILSAMPGMPTLYDGDDLGATGYDTEKKNVYLQGRQRVHNEWADTESPRYKEFIANYKKEIDKAMALRTNPNCNALNNGAPFVLPMQHGHNPFGGDGNDYNIPAVLQQSTDGRMTISLFNLHRNTDKSRPAYDNVQKLDTKCVKLPCIELNHENGVEMNGKMGVGIKGLKHNIKFYNANDPNDIYYVNEKDGYYVIKRSCDDGQITINEPTLVLYSNPQNTPLSFTGQYHIKPNSNIISKSYNQKENTCGKKLCLCK